MSFKKVAALFVVVLIVNVSVQAMVVPGRWEKVAAEKPGSRIIVTMKTGDRVEGVFVGLSKDSLVITTPDGMERDYNKADVLRITSARKRADSLGNGIAIGAAVAGIPTGIIALGCRAAGTCTGEQAALVFAIWTGIGAGIGLAVDANVKDYVTLYEAPTALPQP